MIGAPRQQLHCDLILRNSTYYMLPEWCTLYYKIHLCVIHTHCTQSGGVPAAPFRPRFCPPSVVIQPCLLSLSFLVVKKTFWWPLLGQNILCCLNHTHTFSHHAVISIQIKPTVLLSLLSFSEVCLNSKAFFRRCKSKWLRWLEDFITK